MARLLTDLDCKPDRSAMDSAEEEMRLVLEGARLSRDELDAFPRREGLASTTGATPCWPGAGAGWALPWSAQCVELAGVFVVLQPALAPKLNDDVIMPATIDQR